MNCLFANAEGTMNYLLIFYYKMAGHYSIDSIKFRIL